MARTLFVFLCGRVGYRVVSKGRGRAVPRRIARRAVERVRVWRSISRCATIRSSADGGSVPGGHQERERGVSFCFQEVAKLRAWSAKVRRQTRNFPCKF